MLMDVWVSPDGLQIIERDPASTETHLVIKGKKFTPDNSDRSDDRLSLIIARHNYMVDTNNKYYKNIFDLETENFNRKWR